MRRIGIVACSKTKLDHAAPAQDLYTSPLFKLSRAYAEACCDEWLILSARHGVVSPWQVIEPYDDTLTGKRRGELMEWAMEAHWDLMLRYPVHYLPDYEFVQLAGSRYGRALIGMRTIQPFIGLGIGQQMAWLKRHLEPGADR